MGAYSKLWGSIIGGVVGVLVGWLASRGIATCTDAANPDTCTVLGLTTAQITTALTLLFSALGTFLAPKNASA